MHDENRDTLNNHSHHKTVVATHATMESKRHIMYELDITLI